MPLPSIPPRRHALLVSMCLFCLTGGASAQSLSLGAVHFPTSGAPEAQGPFLRGLAALHSFWYDEARAAFQEAQRLDPDFAMAYWGEAMTYDFPFGSQPDVAAAQAVLARLAPTPETRLSKAGTVKEKGFLEAVGLLFGEGDQASREAAYADAMEKLYAAYPKDLEVGSFYALSILGKIRLGQDLREAMQAAALLESLFERDAGHPGVLHYLLHAYDDALHAPLGLRAARLYADVAPAASHARHMPSHIFVQLGLWDEVAASNASAYAASVASADQRGLTPDRRDLHSLYWLLYANLQQGQPTAAQSHLDEVARIAEAHPSMGARINHALMQARFVLETHRWDQRPRPADAEPFANDLIKSSILLAAGTGAAQAGDLTAAREAEALLRTLQARNEAAGNEEDAAYLAVMAYEVAAEISLAEGEADAALEALKQAATLEQALPLPIGPPLPGKPALERYGEVLLDLGQPEEAWQAFEKSLLRTRNRPASLLGLARAAAQSGDRAQATQHYRTLLRIWSEADPGHDGMEEAQRFLDPQDG